MGKFRKQSEELSKLNKFRNMTFDETDLLTSTFEKCISFHCLVSAFTCPAGVKMQNRKNKKSSA